MMQDRYAGDIVDFGKFGLLKSLISAGFYLGVNWYKAEPLKNEKDQNTRAFFHKDGKHKIKAAYFPCDEPLAKALLDISEHMHHFCTPIGTLNLALFHMLRPAAVSISKC